MTRNGVFCEGADVIISRIAENRSDFTHAFLDTYPLSDDQVDRLSAAIRSNSHLQYINLFDCHISQEKLATLLSALKENNTIQELVINQDIGEQMYREFMAAVSQDENPTNTF